MHFTITSTLSAIEILLAQQRTTTYLNKKRHFFLQLVEFETLYVVYT